MVARKTSRLLSCFVSIAMVLALVPAPALAEVADEVAPYAMGAGLAGEGEGQDVPADPIATAEESAPEEAWGEEEPTGDEEPVVPDQGEVEEDGEAALVPLDQPLESLSHVADVALETQFILKINYFRQPAVFHLGRNVVRIVAGGKGAGALGIGEHIGIVIAHFAHYAQGVLMILLCLSAEPGNHVRGYRAVGHHLTDFAHAVKVPLPGVAAAHLLQHHVASALDRKMDVLTDIVISFSEHLK